MLLVNTSSESLTGDEGDNGIVRRGTLSSPFKGKKPTLISSQTETETETETGKTGTGTETGTEALKEEATKDDVNNNKISIMTALHQNPIQRLKKTRAFKQRNCL